MYAQNEVPNKAAIRTKLSSLRNTIDIHTRSIWSVAACKQLAQFVEKRKYKSIMVYISFRSELDLKDFIVWCWENKMDVIVPRCHAVDHSMTLHRLRNWDELREGSYGILEPDPELSPALPQSFVPDMVVVPGLAFDTGGGRMGYGGGYYDRFAQSIGASPNERDNEVVWIGAAFEAQLVEHVPTEAHDLRLDGVVTEKSSYFVHKMIQE
ncbi:5-formyltetrahydrofolate cyclo-ligase [Paenibacillus sp. GSMTC-2017]|uniref:5-formyltetrahydrofolate cyclo-ligase n=1 Tax=Paenibacillus sp. GSMTC-2017 TaxID=2794350 RepID=UPI0018D8EECC|nr:5-formyltetrahydrofolate cyclo-ligase [Paenibacillus sp. GSMTC-2017]MBH5320033.1 5-formyltetrahydrofolate cyclo-ligase [Paenibacillus sp. GSMTC-2017]